jgi:CheY-like chemotaxis protein
VHEAEDGASGLEAAARLQPDCILLDLRLSGESGYEVLFTLMKQDGLPKIPVIMLTGAAWNALEAGARSLGASDYLIKGKIDAPGLDRAIRGVILQALTAPRHEIDQVEPR